MIRNLCYNFTVVLRQLTITLRNLCDKLAVASLWDFKITYAIFAVVLREFITVAKLGYVHGNFRITLRSLYVTLSACK